MSWLIGNKVTELYGDEGNPYLSVIYKLEVVNRLSVYSLFNDIQSMFSVLDSWPNDEDICMHYLPEHKRWWS